MSADTKTNKYSKLLYTHNRKKNKQRQPFVLIRTHTHTQTHTHNCIGECVLITLSSARDAPTQRASVQTLNTDHRQAGQCFILAREHYRLITPP